jgi:ABC-type branched-subunit amino acid transport system permease subunit
MTGTLLNTRQLRHAIATFTTYEEASRAVDVLAERKFPIEHLTIVGCGLELVEQVTGRATLLRAALVGAGAGAWFGLFMGLVFWIVSPWAPVAILSGIALGAAFGAIFGVATHLLRIGRPEFASVKGLTAQRYEVLADSEYADDALRVLQGLPPADSRR